MLKSMFIYFSLFLSLEMESFDQRCIDFSCKSHAASQKTGAVWDQRIYLGLEILNKSVIWACS